MKKAVWMSVAVLACAGVAAAAGMTGKADKAAAAQDWSINATIIEACSCPMFCQCYFNLQPAAHGGHGHHGEGGEHFCRFNNAFKVNRGHYGATKLDGALFWVAGDLGGDFSEGKLDWAMLHFDPSVSQEQRDGIAAILGHVYPAEWSSFGVGKDLPMEWTASKDRAVARLDGGKAAEVVLHRQAGNTDDPIVIHNLKYWGVPRNDGFVLMPNEVEAYRLGDNKFEFKGTNGFMITIDMASKDAQQASR
jgi:hypothetical protein